MIEKGPDGGLDHILKINACSQLCVQVLTGDEPEALLERCKFIGRDSVVVAEVLGDAFS